MTPFIPPPLIAQPSDWIQRRQAAIHHLYQQAQDDRVGFWETQAKSLYWDHPWQTPLVWTPPHAQWFLGGELNASANCLDRHLGTPIADQIAIQWQGEMGDTREITYRELTHHVGQWATMLLNHGVTVGTRVTIVMPMIPEAIMAILAVVRIGAIHNVIFAGFSEQAIHHRLLDSGSECIITATGGSRRGQVVPLYDVVMAASQHTPVRHVLVVHHTPISTPIPVHQRVETHLASATPVTPYRPMPSEAPLFMLYTSGTTGKPKGLFHTTGGYLTHAVYSMQLVFDCTPQDRVWCTADVGWITGHTYGVYGPLSVGATVVLVEGTPDYPDKDRYWELVERYQVTILYTSPTAIRQMMTWGDHYPRSRQLNSLRLLGCVGEPINPEAWRWYHEVIGNGRCPIVDTWWQTETGGIMMTTLPGYDPMMPGVAGRPLPGIEIGMAPNHPDWLAILSPWPSMARGIWGDRQRYEDTYFDEGIYLSGDGAIQQAPNQWQILGRLDDVVNVAGHRIGTMEIESALVGALGVVEAAAIGVPDPIKGQTMVCFVRLADGAVLPSESDLKAQVVVQLGGIARPSRVWVVPDLPKTRSGKIMRRVLKALVTGDSLGDVSTLQDPSVVDRIHTLLHDTP